MEMQLESQLQTVCEQRLLKKMILSKPRDSQEKRGEVRVIEGKNGISIQITRLMRDGKALHENFAGQEMGKELASLFIDGKYRQGNLFLGKDGEKECQILVSTKGKIVITGGLGRLLENSVMQPVQTEGHNKEKHRILPAGEPVDFLVQLGISDSTGRILDKKQDKYRQINRFLEFIDDLAEYFPKNRPVRVLDFGCGKSYLTFALHYYFTQVLGRQTDIIGLDLKEDVVSFCNEIAKKLSLHGICFQVGDIGHFAPIERVDLTVSLHACDTATDAALAQAVKSGSRTIVSVPCCHHELANQISCPSLKVLTEYGILKHRLADLATDALRGKYLEAAGYQVQVFEFIQSEHTPKNLMIRGVLRNSERNRDAYDQYCAARDFLGVSPSLERMLPLEF